MVFTGLTIQMTYAQSQDLIRGLPQNSQGYLIWNDDKANVRYWNVTITQKTADFSTTPTSFQEQELEKYEIWGKNFLKLDKSLWNLNKPGTLNYATISGYNGSDSIIVSRTNVLEVDFPPVGDPVYDKGCAWQCVSGNYAYRIQQYKKIGNPDQGHYSVHPAYYLNDDESGTQISYYRYLDEPEVLNYTNNFAVYYTSGGIIDYDIYGNPIYQVPILMNPNFHGVSEWVFTEVGNIYGNQNFHKFQQYDENSGVNYTDINGTLILTPTVYALRKYTGWWRKNIRVPQYNDFDISNDCVNGDLLWALDLINGPNSNLEFLRSSQTSYPEFPYHPDNIPDMACVGSPGGSGPSMGDSFSFWDCLYSAGFFDNIGDGIEDAQDATSYWDYLAAVSGCVQDGNGGGHGGGGVIDTPAEVISNLEFLSIEHIGSVSDTLLHSYVHSDLIDSLGNYTPGRNEILDLGLYKMTFKYPTTNINYIIFENKKRVNTTVPLSSFVEANIYPVPLKDDYKFNINLSTSATSKFLYKLLDINGNLVYEKRFILEKDHDEVHEIISNVQIPSGVLINRFEFEDGSSFSITTNK